MSLNIKSINPGPGTRPIKPILPSSSPRKYNGSKNPVVKEQQRVEAGTKSFSDHLKEQMSKFDVKV